MHCKPSNCVSQNLQFLQLLLVPVFTATKLSYYLRLEEGRMEVRRGAGDGGEVHGSVGGVGERDGERVRSCQRGAAELERGRRQRQRARRHRAPAARARAPTLAHRLLAPFLEIKIIVITVNRNSG